MSEFFIRNVFPILAVSPVILLAYSVYTDRKNEEIAHQSLPAIIQPYDINRDGVLQLGEIEKLIRDHPELKSSQKPAENH